LRTAPKSRNTGGSTRKSPLVSALWASQRSQVAKAIGMKEAPEQDTEPFSNEKNNIPEGKMQFLPWKRAFLPLASAVPVKKQFFAGD
jgi:hypothetical protein